MKMILSHVVLVSCIAAFSMEASEVQLPALVGMEVKSSVHESDSVFDFQIQVKHTGTELSVFLVLVDLSSDTSREQVSGNGVVVEGSDFQFKVNRTSLLPDQYVLVGSIVKPSDWLEYMNLLRGVSWSPRPGVPGIDPGTPPVEFGFKSRALPGIRDITLIPDLLDITPVVDGVTVLTEDVVAALKASDVILQVIGPVAPPLEFDALSFLTEVLAYQQQAETLNWSRASTALDEVDGLLSAIEASLISENLSAAGSQIDDLVAVVETNACSGFDCDPAIPFTTEARALLVYNMAYLKSKLDIPPDQDVTLFAGADSFVRSGSPNRNEGANPRLIVRRTGKNRGLVSFDLSNVDVANVQTATLRLNIAENANNWGSSDDRTVDVHALLSAFEQGNGQNLGVPASDSTRGEGVGVTWNCSIDDDIGNQQANCGEEWDGGFFTLQASDSITHINDQIGPAYWDVTADVKAGMSGWLIKKTNEGKTGKVKYYSIEGAFQENNSALGPSLILAF